ncbi:hypothetical protein GCM10011578_001330 [Streptomyces fuscichromogenes]|uniref:PPM-type phosphatase domain-containing protein n=1 Tax=Streptomyces fuscichromogenes TaxID=1324013 RepID=A0A917UFT2_9ACTN|nr:hypothetical protein GCM10011578_001330 [Streptomyces fuscichromogenes]
MPSAPSCEAPEFALVGALVPAADIAGDTYDYTLDHDTLHLSVTDAMGHDVSAALMATLLVNASRDARRAGCDLAEQGRQTHEVLLAHGRQAFATGQLLRIALDGTSSQLVNAGHPWPLRLRDGTVDELRPAVNLPFARRERSASPVSSVTPAPRTRARSCVLWPPWSPTPGAATRRASHPQGQPPVLCLDW